MDSKNIANGILRAAGILIGIAILLLFLYKIQSVIVYLVIAAVISLIGRPLIIFLRRRLKINNTVAVIITMMFMLSILVGLISMFIPLIREQGKNLSLLNMEELQANLEAIYFEVTDYLRLNQIDVKKSLEESGILADLNFSAIPNFLNSIASTLGSFSVGLFSVIFISFFFLKDSHLLESGLMILVPDSKESALKVAFEKIKDLLSRYFIGLVLQILILFVIYTIVLLVIGIENAVVIAFLCALLNLVPYVGPLVGGFLMVILTMSSNLGHDFSTVILPKSIYVMIGFGIGQVIDNFFSQPFIFSNSVKSHPLEIFLIIIIGGLLFGITGMILAVPGYTAIKVTLKEFLAENKIVRSLTKNL